MPTPIAVKKLGHVVYSVSDIRQSTDFWTRVLGFEVSDINEKGMVFLRMGPDHHTIGLKEVAGAVRHAAGPGVERFGFAVDNLDDAESRLKAHGIAVERVRAEDGLDRLNFSDPDGFPLALFLWQN